MRTLIGWLCLWVAASAQTGWYVQIGGTALGNGGAVTPFPTIPPLPVSFSGTVFYGVSASVDPLSAIVSASSAPIAFTYQ